MLLLIESNEHTHGLQTAFCLIFRSKFWMRKEKLGKVFERIGEKWKG